MKMIGLSLMLSVAVLLGISNMSFAQHSHTGSSGSSSSSSGSHGSTYYGGNSHTSGYYGHSYYGGVYSGIPTSPYYSHSGYYGHDWYHDHGYYGHGGYGWPGYGFYVGFPWFVYPWGYSRYNYGYGAPYYYGSYYYGPPESYTPAPPVPPPDMATGASEEYLDPNVANLEVRLPANAELWVLGQTTAPTGEVRHFFSPPLKPGQTYTYDFRARWTDANGKAVEQTRKVDVKAGAWIGVDFTRQQ